MNKRIGAIILATTLATLSFPAIASAHDHPHGHNPHNGYGWIVSAVEKLSAEVQQLLTTQTAHTAEINNLTATVNAQAAEIANLQSEIQGMRGIRVQTVAVTELDASGQPFYAPLTLFPLNGGPAIGYNPSASNPSSNVVYMTNVPDGTYQIAANLPEYQLAQPTTVTVLGSGSTNVTVRLTTDVYAVSGVAEMTDGEPLANQPITFTDSHGNVLNYGWATSPNGSFSVDDLPPGTYTIHIGQGPNETFTITNTNISLGTLQ